MSGKGPSPSGPSVANSDIVRYCSQNAEAAPAESCGATKGQALAVARLSLRFLCSTGPYDNVVLIHVSLCAATLHL